MSRLLDDVRTACTRSKTKLYDDELKIYIDSVFYDLERLNIAFDKDSPSPEIRTCIIVYVKSKFGPGNEAQKELMAKAYDDLLTKIYLDVSHRKQ